MVEVKCQKVSELGQYGARLTSSLSAARFQSVEGSCGCFKARRTRVVHASEGVGVSAVGGKEL